MGIKVQFVLPQTLQGDAKAAATQKLQAKLNQGLSQYNLTVSQDTDVPYANVIGFLIPIADIKLLIKNAIGAGTAPAEKAPATAAPAPEAPVAEVKRMQQLAGLVKENFEDTSDYDDMFNDENEDSSLDILSDTLVNLPLEDFIKVIKTAGDYDIWIKGAEDMRTSLDDKTFRAETISTFEEDDIDRYNQALQST